MDIANAVSKASSCTSVFFTSLEGISRVYVLYLTGGTLEPVLPCGAPRAHVSGPRTREGHLTLTWLSIGSFSGSSYSISY